MSAVGRSAAAVLALLLGAACVVGQDRTALEAFDAYLACDDAAAVAETAAQFRTCYAPESRMANLPEAAVLELLQREPPRVTARTLVDASGVGDTIELRIRGRFEGDPVAERVRMRNESGEWKILDVRTRAYPGALTALAEDRPLAFELVIDGETVLTEANAVVVPVHVGFPSLSVTPLFADEPAMQIDNLRLASQPQTFAARPADALLADPALVSASVRADAIPIRHDVRGELHFSARDERTASGRIRLLVRDLTMDEPIDVVFGFENLPLRR